MKFLWTLVILSCFVGGFFWIDFFSASGASQQAAAAAMAVATVVIPYIFSKAVEGISSDNLQEKILEELKELNNPTVQKAKKFDAGNGGNDEQLNGLISVLEKNKKSGQ